MEKDKTLFAIKVHNHFSDKTKKGAAGNGLAMLVAGVSAGIVGVLGLKLVGGWMFELALLLSPFFAIWGGIYIVFNLLRPVRKVVCPSCKLEHNIFQNARSYACPACNQFFFLGEETIKQPTFSICPYCGLKTAVCEDAGPYLCPDCGITLKQKIQRANEQKNCPSCGSRIPSEAVYCRTCGEILRTDIQNLEKEDDKELNYDLEWKAGKSTLGHFYYSKTIILSINNLLEKSNLKGFEKSPFVLLEEALLSLEVASIDAKIYEQCGSLLPQLDKTYRNLLGWELSVFDSVFSQSERLDSFPPLPLNEEYFTARRRVERIFGDALESFGSIGKWNEKLLEWQEITKSPGMLPQRHQLDNYDRLKEEKLRFDKWASKQLEI